MKWKEREMEKREVISYYLVSFYCTLIYCSVHIHSSYKSLFWIKNLVWFWCDTCCIVHVKHVVKEIGGLCKSKHQYEFLVLIMIKYEVGYNNGDFQWKEIILRYSCFLYIWFCVITRQKSIQLHFRVKIRNILILIYPF